MANEKKDESEISILDYVESKPVGKDNLTLVGKRIHPDGSLDSLKLDAFYIGNKGFFMGVLSDKNGEAMVVGRLCSKYLTFKTRKYGNEVYLQKGLPSLHQAEKTNGEYKGHNTHHQSKSISEIIFALD